MATEQKSDPGETVGCMLVLVIVGAIVYGVYYFLIMPDTERLANQYDVPVERVSAPPKPHGCAFGDAPLGDKHCHYDKHVYLYDKNGQLIEVDGKRQQCPGCGPVWSVEQAYVRVEE